MAEHVIKLPDVGEGIAEAELVEWHVKVGDLVREDTPLGAVMTDKATVEIPSPVQGEVLWLAGNVGDVIAIGSDFVRLNVNGTSQRSAANNASEAAPTNPVANNRTKPLPDRPPAENAAHRIGAAPSSPVSQSAPTLPTRQFSHDALGLDGAKPLAAPAVRLRAREAGVDLRQVAGSGPAGRITHDDVDAFLGRGSATTPTLNHQARTSIQDIKIVGLRRRIAEKMSIASARIPHITYVEEVDVTALEALRATLNTNRHQDRPKLTLLPFLMLAMVRAIAEQPSLNAHFDDDAGVVHQHAGVHIGIAVQTQTGLMVPVVRHAEALDLWGCAAQASRLAEAAKAGQATREQLSGSTISITSLGAMGGLVTTPIINHPEVAIIGVNKIAIRPHWDGSAFIPRKMMNLSSSFDHRVIDGWDAALFVQRIKTLLETPALIFIDG